MTARTISILAALAIGAALSVSAQESFSTGQNVAPAYEGWEKNADGSFNLVFGYFNRNWEEQIDTPVGLANAIDPGGPDRGQPTLFQPRRNLPPRAVRFGEAVEQDHRRIRMIARQCDIQIHARAERDAPELGHG